MSWTCEFCGSGGEKAYPVTIGTHSEHLMRCLGCGSYQVENEIPAEALHDLYSNSYFYGTPPELERADRLASDYLTKVRPFLRPREGARSALEIGAGYGYFAERLLCLEGVTVDVVEPNLSCRERIGEELPKVGLVAETWQDLSVQSTYDWIFGFHLVEHLPRFAPFLEAVSAAARPGARLFFITPNAGSRKLQKHGEEWGWACPDQHLQFLSRSIPASYWARFGLRVVSDSDITPRAVGYPSALLPRLKTWESKLTRMIKASSSASITRRAIRRLVRDARKALEPGGSEGALRRLERHLDHLIVRRRRDELLIVLDKAA